MRWAARLAVLGVLLALDAAQAQQPRLSVGLSFTGTSYLRGSRTIVPDTMGAVGPGHIVELINGSYAVYDKDTGARLQRSTLDRFWRRAGVAPRDFAFDPRILYDPSARRWYATAVDAADEDNSILVAVSLGRDPRRGWVGFEVDSDSQDRRWADFPTLGFNPDGVLISAIMFPIPGRGASDEALTTILSIPKRELIRTNHAPTIVRGPPGSQLAALAAPQARAAPPRPLSRVPPAPEIGIPAADPNGRRLSLLVATEARRRLSPTVTVFENLDPSRTGFVVQPVVDTSREGRAAALLSAFNTPTGLFKRSWVEDPGGIPILDTAGGLVEVRPFEQPPTADQPGPRRDLDAGSNRFSANIILQNGSYWGVQSVRSRAGRAALRWLEIDATTLDLRQAGLIANRNLDFYYGSIAVNPAGEVVIGFSGSGPTQFVSAYAVAGVTRGGRTRFGPPVVLERGRATYQRLGVESGDNRWGDYSATVVDPSDPSTFWTFQEFVLRRDIWAIQITEMRVR
jgi:hypothetical protein